MKRVVDSVHILGHVFGPQEVVRSTREDERSNISFQLNKLGRRGRCEVGRKERRGRYAKKANPASVYLIAVFRVCATARLTDCLSELTNLCVVRFERAPKLLTTSKPTTTSAKGESTC